MVGFTLATQSSLEVEIAISAPPGLKDFQTLYDRLQLHLTICLHGSLMPATLVLLSSSFEVRQ